MNNGEHCKDHPRYCDGTPAVVSPEQMRAYATARGLPMGAPVNIQYKGYPDQLLPLPKSFTIHGCLTQAEAAKFRCDNSPELIIIDELNPSTLKE